MVKPSDTRWLSHERCIRAILKELPALITTLQEFYEESGDAEAYGLASVLSSYSGAATNVLLSVVLDLLAKLNGFMQRKAIDFSKLPIVLQSITEEIKHLKDEKAEWCTLVETTVELLSEHDITLMHISTRGRHATTMAEFRDSLTVPYIDVLLPNINARFSNAVVKLLVSSSVFHPALLPAEETALADYGKKELQVLVDFYGKEATVEFEGSTYTSPPLASGEDVIAEWRVFKWAFAKETKAFLEKSPLAKPTLQDVKAEVEASSAYTDIFPASFDLMNLILTLPVGTASVERTLSQMKMVKTRLRNRISDVNLPELMRIVIEGPDLSIIDFEEILEVFKGTTHRIQL